MTVVRKRDQFPIGMRVLAVDDDPTCLKVLESLLHRCQYHVTTTNQAVKALEMLRENKNQFDLVISDVHMPDMDGFKLLEHVGLEMDLPVIMLSANGETQAVMKGITHGACDYLIKPVRYEELKNIWQHVIRRKKHDPNDQNNFDSGDDSDRNQLANPERPQGSFANSKINRKRKDQIEEYEDDGESTLHENEDSSSQKKPRVVWSVELHRKFVGAVNQLGIDKAVPKRILDLMNVEGITRENVASHLQKYRLYLKRLSAVANQQANMVAALRGSRDTSYMPIGSLDPYSNYNSIIGSKPLQSNGSIPKLNTFNGFGFHGFVPPTTRGPVNDITKIQGMQESSRSLIGGFTPKNHIRMPLPVNSDPFEVNIGNSLNFVDVNRCNDTWQNAAASSNLYNSNTNIAPVNNLKWEQPVQGQFCNSSGTYNSSSSPLVSNAHIGDVSRKMDLPIIGESSYSSPLSIHDYKPEQLNYKDDQLFVDTKLSNGFVSSNFGLDDLVARTMVKPECEDFSFIEDDVGCSDLYSLGACM